MEKNPKEAITHTKCGLILRCLNPQCKPQAYQNNLQDGSRCRNSLANMSYLPHIRKIKNSSKYQSNQGND